MNLASTSLLIFYRQLPPSPLVKISFAPQPFAAIKKKKDGGHNTRDKRLNTGMAPTCDWMIKIIKVNNLGIPAMEKSSAD